MADKKRREFIGKNEKKKEKKKNALSQSPHWMDKKLERSFPSIQ